MRSAFRRSLAVAMTFAFFAMSAPLYAADEMFEDEWIRVELPKGWSLEGEGGEYRLDSGSEDIASLLVLPPDPDRTLEALLADIEEQFLSTGMFAIEGAEDREIDGEPVHSRRYRMTSGAGGSASTTVHHQFSFWRDDAQVLLQVETGEKSASPERLLAKVFSTLRVIAAPHPFLHEDYEGWGDEGGELGDDVPIVGEPGSSMSDSLGTEDDDVGAEDDNGAADDDDADDSTERSSGTASPRSSRR